MVTLSEVQMLFESAEKLPIKPSFEDFPVYVPTDVIDEDKTVKWNRAEIRKRMEARNNEIERLKQVKGLAMQDAHEHALQYMSEQTGMSLTHASIIWEFVITSIQNNRSNLTFWQQLEAQLDLYRKLAQTQ